VDDQKKLIFAGALGLLLLWWLTRPKSAPAPADSAAMGNALPPSPVNAVPPAAAPVATPVIVAPPRPAPLDVAGTISDGTQDLLQRNGGTLVLWTPDTQAIYEQLWLPASKIPLSNLGPEDWLLAKQFLENSGGEFSRRDDLGTLGKELLANASYSSGGAVAASVIGMVASIIPIIGAGFNAAMQSSSGASAGSAAWDEAMGNGQLGGVIRSALSQPTMQTRHLLMNYSDTTSAVDGPEAKLDRRVMNLPEQIGIMPAQTVTPASPVFSVGTTSTGIGVLASMGNVRQFKFRIRLRLFSRYAGGWVLPWLSAHFNGDKLQAYDSILGAVGTRQTINARARVFRAVDAIICQYSPYVREDAPHGYWSDASVNAHFPPDRAPRFAGAGESPTDQTVYFYSNPYLGPMMGSIFPPTKEDRRYIGGDGREYSYYGEPRKSSNVLAIGAMDDYLVDPSRAGELRRSNTGGSSM
jgi:hypothetical protein